MLFASKKIELNWMKAILISDLKEKKVQYFPPHLKGVSNLV